MTRKVNYDPKTKKYVKLTTSSKLSFTKFRADPKLILDRMEGKHYDRNDPKWKKLKKTNVLEATNGENSQENQSSSPTKK